MIDDALDNQVLQEHEQVLNQLHHIPWALGAVLCEFSRIWKSTASACKRTCGSELSVDGESDALPMDLNYKVQSSPTSVVEVITPVD